MYFGAETDAKRRDAFAHGQHEQWSDEHGEIVSERRSRRPRRGTDLLHDPRLNKGTAFTEAERDAFGLRGLLPPRVFTLAEQQQRIIANFRQKASDLEKYIFLTALLDRNETLFYRVVIDNIEEMLPIIYTPTVGEACQQYGRLLQRPRGLYVSAKERGRIELLLRNWSERDVAIIVVTDGERILGLGDLGANGMGIPIGKLSLYTACAGIHPARTLPVALDVGTNNQELLRDPLYIGLQRPRMRGAEYDAFMDEFMAAVQRVFPKTLIQFEDFATENALHLLQRYRDRTLAFNDDIQGTAAVTLAGLSSAARVTGRPVEDQTLLFFGAGAAATGIADLVALAMTRGGLPELQARRRCWFMDSRGLVVESRNDLAEHKLPYAHRHAPVVELSAAVTALRPTTLIGVSGHAQTFTEPVIRAMTEHNERPIIFALSNPTSKSECTAEQAYAWSNGRAVFASGSPFPPVDHGATRFVPRQANNAYVFPGLGLGVIASRARRVTDAMFLAAAWELASQTDEASLERGALFPPLACIRDVSAAIALAVAQTAVAEGTAPPPRTTDLASHIRSLMYEPVYQEYKS